MLRIILFSFVAVCYNFAAGWSFNLANLFEREIFPYCCVTALMLVVYLLLYELNVLCIAIIIMLFAFSTLLLGY